MARRRSRSRQGRAQRLIAVILLVCLTSSGMALYAASHLQPASPQPIQQSR